jgi:enoyl-CoA hydratase/carnithine racemase
MAELLVEKEDHVAILTLNRPERMNAISTKSPRTAATQPAPSSSTRALDA